MGNRYIGFDMIREKKFWLLLSVYGIVIATSFYLAYEVRFDFHVPQEFQEERIRMLSQVIVLKLILLIILRQTGSMLTFFSIPDMLKIGWVVALAGLLLFLPKVIGMPELTAPRGVLLIDSVVSFALLCGFRLGMRMYRERLSGSSVKKLTSLERIAIIGAGEAGASLAKDYLTHPKRGFLPILFLDDDVSKHGKLIHGVMIAGKPEDLPFVRIGSGIRKVVVAIPSTAQKRIREIVVFLTSRGFKVEIIPSMDELATGRVRMSKVRPVDIEDLLGREQVELDRVSIRKFIEGKVVLVTGAGGSIGSELCRQVAQQNPKRLLLLDQSEGSLFLIEQELNDRGVGAISEPLVADVIDESRLNYLFDRYKPQVVFHAAAHKHVFMMERQPMEAIRNNAVGTKTIANISARHGVEAFVLISTDKAINPTNVMGASKRLAELQLQAIQRRNSSVPGKRATRFMAVRFGNVLGSSGSVIPIFRKQIEAGGPVTVTHPDVTRYFMTIPEAVGLVMQAAVLGTKEDVQGDFSIFVLDMGSPVRIVDLATQMISLSGLTVGEDIEIKFIGLKPGEKLFEELQHKTEEYIPTEHPRIMRFVSPKSTDESITKCLEELESQLYLMDNNSAKRLLQNIIPEYTPHWE